MLWICTLVSSNYCRKVVGRSTNYQKECGLTQSTIGNIFRQNTVSSVSILETTCLRASYFAFNTSIVVSR